MTKKTKPFLLTTLLVMMGKAGGALVPFLIAFFYGASPTTDAFFFAYSLIAALLMIFSHVYETSLVPFIVEREENIQKEMALVLCALALGLPLCLILGLGTGLFVPSLLIRQSMPEETSLLIGRLFMEMLPGLMLAVLISAYQGFFYARKNFWFPSVSTLIRTITMIAFLILGRQKLGIHSLTLGFVAGEILRWAAAHVVLNRQGTLRYTIPSGEFQKVLGFFQEAGFQILALVAVSIIPLADQWSAAPLGPGKLSLFNYADRLLQIPYLLFFYGFTQVFFSFWSETHVKEGRAVFFKKTQRDICLVFWAILAAVVILWAAAKPVIQILFFKSYLTELQRVQLTEIFRWLSLAFLPGILRALYARVLVILRESKTYFYQAWVELLAKVGLNVLFTSRFGIVGLAMSTLTVYSLTTAWFYFYVKGQTHKEKA
jgi:putative peptidoglycan lipid II flippase